MILLQSLTLRNFLSHEATDVSFTPNQKLLIDGNSGSGKSAILEAIIWVLYGTGRTSNAALIRRGTDKAEVTLVLTRGAEEITITRVVTKSKHTLTVVIDGVAHPYTGVRELQNWIETELTGASYLLFVNSIAYVQGGPDSFVTQNATKRKDLLLEIVKTIDFDQYYEKTKAKITEAEKEIVGHEQSIEVRQQWLTTAEETVKGKGAAEEAIARFEIEEDIALKSREASVIALSKVEEQEKNITRVSTDLNLLRNDVITTQRNIDSMSAEAFALASSMTEQLRDRAYVEQSIVWEKLQCDNINKEIGEAASVNEARVTLLSTKPLDLSWNTKAEDVNKLLSDPSNHNKCSNTDCPYFHEKAQKIGDYAALYAEYSQKHGAYVEALRLWQESYDALPVIDLTPLREKLLGHQNQVSKLEKELSLIIKRETDLARVKSLYEKTDELKSQLAEKKAKEELMSLELDNLKSLLDQDELTKNRDNIRNCDTILYALRQGKASKQQVLGGILDTEARIPETKQALDESLAVITATKQNIYRLGLLKDAFGSKGLKAIVIDYIIPELEEKINNILAQMSEFRVVLDTQQEKADGEGNKEGLFITIINDMGEEMPFESYSGGERLKIIVSITEALATLQKCGFRLYDETWVGLDDNSLESFAKVLDNLIERFPQVVCVSHLQEIKAAFENRLFVTKHNGISHVN